MSRVLNEVSPSVGRLTTMLRTSMETVELADLLAGLLDSLPVGVAMAEATSPYPFVYANPVMEGRAGDGRGVIGRSWLAAFPGAEHNGVLELLRAVADTGRPVHRRDFRWRGPVGEGGASDAPTVWNFDIYPLLDQQSNVTHFVIVSVDVTAQATVGERLLQAQKRAETAMLEVSRHLRATPELPTFFGQLSRTVAELVGADRAAFWMLDDHGLRVRPEGYGFEERVLTRMRNVPCAVDGTDRLARVVHADEVLRAQVDLDHPETHPHRELISTMGIRSVLMVSWRAGDEVIGALGAYDSSTPGGFTEEDAHVLRVAALAAGVVLQHKRAEQRIAELQERENDKLRAHARRMTELERTKSEFLKLASHELRAPLAVQRGYLSMLEDGSLGPVPENIQRVVRVMSTKTAEMNALVDAMLETARLEEGRLQLRLSPADLRDLVREAALGMDEQLSTAHVLELEIGQTVVPVTVDRERILMVLNNLLSNAVKYAPEGGIITCSVEARGECARVAVTDHGMGIRQQDLPVLFTRFGRIVTAENSHIPGTGLGLYLARELTVIHGGELEVVSVAGRGSTFTLSLPLHGTEPAGPEPTGGE